MKIHPLLKSVGIIILIEIIHFVTQEYFFVMDGGDFGGTSITNIGLITISTLTSISFISPFYFFKRIDILKSFFSFFCISIFIGSLLFINDNYLLKLIELSKIISNFLSITIRHDSILFCLILPVGLFFISKIFFFNVNWKFLVLLLASFPIVLLLENSIIYNFLTSIYDQPNIFSFLLLPNIASNIYLSFSSNALDIDDDNVLDSPNL